MVYDVRKATKQNRNFLTAQDEKSVCVRDSGLHKTVQQSIQGTLTDFF